MQSASSSSSSGSYQHGIDLLFKNKAAFIQEIESNRLLGEPFSNSFNKPKNRYEITANDTPWICHCKSLINALNILEKHPDILESAKKFLKNDKSLSGLVVTATLNKSELEKLEYYIGACKYYGTQESGDFLKIVPHVEGITTRFTELAKGFSFIENILNPASIELLDPEQTNLGKYVNTSYLKEQISKVVDLDSMKNFVSNAFDDFRNDFIKIKADLTRMANEKGLLDALPGADPDKEKTRAELINWYHMAESLRINYGLDTTIIEEQLAAQSKNVFGNDYHYWQYASASVSLEQKENERIQLNEIKDLISSKNLSYKTDLRILFELRSKLKEIKSYDVRVYIDHIDYSINKRTNLHALNKKINAIESKITRISCKIDAELDTGAGLKAADSRISATKDLEDELQKLYHLRETLQEKIAAIKSGDSDEFYHFNKKTLHITKGESKHSSGDALVPQKSFVYKKALAAINLALTANTNQTILLEANRERISNRINRLSERESENIFTEKIKPIKKLITDTQLENAENKVRLSDAKAKLQQFADRLVPPTPESPSKIFSMVSIRPFTDEIKKQILKLKNYLDAETQATLQKPNSDEISQKIKDKDKPIVKLIKSCLKTLSILEKNSRNIQEMQALAKVSKARVVKQLIKTDFTKDLHSMPDAIKELQTHLDTITRLISQSPAKNMLNLPIVSQIEKIILPLKTLYEQWRPDNFKLSQVISASSSSPAEVSRFAALKEKLNSLLSNAPKTPETQVIVRQAAELMDTIRDAYNRNSIIDLASILIKSKDLYKNLSEANINSEELHTVLDQTIKNFSDECERKIVLTTNSLQQVFSVPEVDFRSALLQTRESSLAALKDNLQHLKALEKDLGLSAVISTTIAEKYQQADVLAARSAQAVSHAATAWNAFTVQSENEAMPIRVAHEPEIERDPEIEISERAMEAKYDDDSDDDLSLDIPEKDNSGMNLRKIAELAKPIATTRLLEALGRAPNQNQQAQNEKVPALASPMKAR